MGSEGGSDDAAATARAATVQPIRIRSRSGASGPTEKESRGPNWVRTSHGLYVPAGTNRAMPEQRVVEAAALLPAYGGVTGWGALRWAGARWLDGTSRTPGDQVPVTLAIGGGDIRPQPGIAVSSERLSPLDLTETHGMPTTSAVRSTCFEMRYARNVREAVVILDMAAYDDLVSVDEILRYALDHPGWTGIPQARAAIPLADENSWSPWETRMRLIWTLDAGLPRPWCNVPLFDRRGRHIGTPDLIDVEAGIVGEYDGALHLEGAQRGRDVRREALFRAHGLEHVTMLAGDMAHLGAFVDRLTNAHRRARRLDETRRSWTVEPPSWWLLSDSVEARRGLTGRARERVVRLRRRAS